MSTTKTSRPMSTPIAVPDKSTKSLRRKSILKNSNLYSSSLDSDVTPASSPDVSTERTRRVSQVRFSDELSSSDAAQMQALYAQHRQRKTSLVGKRKSALKTVTSSSAPASALRRNSRSQPDSDESDSPQEDNNHSNDLDPDYNLMGSSLPVLHVSATMSHEAQYAILKAYEDDLCDRIDLILPDVAGEFKRARTPDNRDVIEPTGLLDFDDVENSDDVNTAMTSSNKQRVANRLTHAMEKLNAIHTELLELENCDRKMKLKKKIDLPDLSKSSMRRLERWCHSLKATLDGLKYDTPEVET